MAYAEWRDNKRERIVTGYFRKGAHRDSYYIELEISKLRWDVYPKPEHLALLDQRVCATGMRVEYKGLSLKKMTLA